MGSNQYLKVYEGMLKVWEQDKINWVTSNQVYMYIILAFSNNQFVCMIQVAAAKIHTTEHSNGVPDAEELASLKLQFERQYEIDCPKPSLKDNNANNLEPEMYKLHLAKLMIANRVTHYMLPNSSAY